MRTIKTLRAAKARRTAGQLVIEQGTGQKDQPGENAHPVQDSQSTTNKVSRNVPGWQYGKRRRRENEGEENKTSDPDDQGQQHQESKERHDGTL
jgi:hypothetical protein